jgi:outer membrane lipoprotein carrier protein
MQYRLPMFALVFLAACGGGDDPESDAAQQPDIAVATPSVPVDTTIRQLPPELPALVDSGGTGVPDDPSGDARVPPQAAAPDGSATSGPPPTSTQQQPPASQAVQILNRAEQAYAEVRSMEADFVQQVEVPLLRETLHSHGKIYHRAPDRFLMRFTEPAGDVIVADGQFGWTYQPSFDPSQVIKVRLTEGGRQVDLQREFLSDASERFDATVTGSEQVGGRATHALTLLPRGQSPYQRVRLWIDPQDFLVRRFEITEQNGSVRTIELSNLRPNVTLADELFRFTPPPGTQIFEP